MRKDRPQSPRYSIGEHAIKIILLKTMVGKEKSIYQAFSNAFRRAGVKNWWAYELLGDYDLCFILERKSLEKVLLEEGTIEGIIHSTDLLCYIWGAKGEELSTILNKKPLICLNILKLKPPCLRDTVIKIDHELAQFISKHGTFCLGSFGWSEFILVNACESFMEIPEFVTATLSIHRTDRAGSLGLFLKSLTLVGINCRHFYPKKKLSFFYREDIDEKFFPTLAMSCRPSQMEGVRNELKNRMKQFNPEVVPAIGDYDLIVNFLHKGSWGRFIDKFYSFRNSMQRSLMKTTLILTGNFEEFFNGFPMAWKFSPMGIPISRTDVLKIKERGLLSPAWETILATIYTFNNYLQNELLADSMIDMVEYVILMQQLCTRNDSTEQKILELIADMPQQIRYGTDQRLSGFMLTEGTEDFTPFKGGKHRLLKALKALCVDMFNLMGVNRWPGFVVIGRNYDFYNDDFVISVPVNAAFAVDTYFGLFHECGHVYITQGCDDKSLSGMDDMFKEPYAAEVFSDLFTFKCGFLGDYPLYLKTMIKYFAGLIYGLTIKRKIDRLSKAETEKIEGYLVRLLSVALYEMAFVQSKDTARAEKEIAEKLLMQLESTISRKPKHIIKETRDEFLNKVTYASFKLKGIREQFEKIYSHSFKSNSVKRKKILSSHKFKILFNKIMRGVIVPDISHPHLVVLKMIEYSAKHGSIPFKANSAAIQSFLDFYYSKDIDGGYFPYEES